MNKRKSPAAAWARTMTRIGQRAVQAGSRSVQRAAGEALRAALKSALPKPVRKTAQKTVRKTAPAAVARILKQAAAKTARRPVPGKTPATAPGRWTSGVALAGGVARRWRLYTPPGLLPGERVPLLVLLHGCGQDADGFAAVTGMHRVADRGRFLVLLPEQDRLANRQGCWNWFDTERGRAQAEADAVLAAIDQACLRRGDRQRVVVAGLSAGAGLAALLALRHPGRLRGVVMHAGVPPGTAHSTLTALAAMRGRRGTAPLEPPPAAGLPALLVIHGTLDGVVAPRNAEAAVQAWAAAAGATARPPRRLQRGGRHVLVWTDHTVGRRVVASLALVQGLGHAWSGGAAGHKFSDPKGPDASRLVWAFAQRLFRRPPG